MKEQFNNKTSGDNGEVTLASQLPAWLRRDWFLGLVLVLAVILVYQPVWYAGFVWDDDIHVTKNPCMVGPLGLKEIWTTNEGQFFPLVLTTFWVEHALWGLAPLPYHLVNVFEQALGAVLLWRVLRSLRVPGAWLGAALWAVHPVQVESVAWISEMKNTQSCLFYLLTILFFVRWIKHPAVQLAAAAVPAADVLVRGEHPSPGRRRLPGQIGTAGWNYGLTLLFAALAMASKSSTVVLPLVLCLCAWWMEGKWRWSHLARVAPVFLMSVVASAITVWPHPPDAGAIAEQNWAGSWPERVARSGDVIWFYLGKLVWPHPLLAIYPRWQIDAGPWVSYLPLLAAIIVLFILWVKRKTWSRPAFFAFAYFLVVLSPFLGLIDQSFWRYSFVQDHLQYLACMGPLALAGAGLARLSESVFSGKRWLQPTICAGLLLAFGMTSWQRVWAYQGEETLWTDELAKNPACWLGHYNLGVALVPTGHMDEAMAQFQKTLKINPGYAQAHDDLGNVLFQKGRLDEAMIQYQEALAINPNYPFAHNNLGWALLQKGRVDQALAQFQKALAINPNYAEAHDNLGLVLSQEGRRDEAMVQFQKAVALNPNLANAHDRLGVALLQKGRLDEAMAQFQMTLAIDPNSVEARNHLDAALLQRGREK